MMLRNVFLTIVFGLVSFANAFAALKIDITQGNVEPIPIAINLFFDESGNESGIGRDIKEVVEQDLVHSGLFRLIDENAFIEQLKVEEVPQFSLWRQVNASAVVSTRITSHGDKITAEFRVWDSNLEEQIAGTKISIKESSWRRLGHKIADEIYKKVTGEAGYFDTKILFVSETGPLSKRVKKLAIIDQDGANYKELTNGKEIVLTPRFDSKSHRAIYMAYNKKVPNVYMLDIVTGQEKKLGNFGGMSFAPRFAPDSNNAIFSIAKNGTTDIYEIDLHTSALKRLTNMPGTINTSPSYSPDGRNIVFTSDRGGSSQLYVMDRNGGGQRRITFSEGGSYYASSWSPRGDYIAFTKKKDGLFYIGVIRPDGSGERLLTSSWMDEGPTFSPNGRVIMFSRQTKGAGYKIYAVDITGFHERMIETPYDASDPAWSGLLN